MAPLEGGVPLKLPLCCRQSLHPRVRRDCLAQGLSEGLEYRLKDMVEVPPVINYDMEVYHGMIAECPEKVFKKRELQPP